MYAVIPAEAGIQYARLLKSILRDWTPASAGVTK